MRDGNCKLQRQPVSQRLEKLRPTNVFRGIKMLLGEKKKKKKWVEINKIE